MDANGLVVSGQTEPRNEAIAEGNIGIAIAAVGVPEVAGFFDKPFIRAHDGVTDDANGPSGTSRQVVENGKVVRVCVSEF